MDDRKGVVHVLVFVAAHSTLLYFQLLGIHHFITNSSISRPMKLTQVNLEEEKKLTQLRDTIGTQTLTGFHLVTISLTGQKVDLELCNIF